MKRSDKTTVSALLMTAALLVTVFLSSCRKEPSANEEQIIRDLSYGESAQQKMDIYLPDNITPAVSKTIVLTHSATPVDSETASLSQRRAAPGTREPCYTW